MVLRFPSRPTLLALCCSVSIGAHAADALVLDATSIDAQTNRTTKGASPDVFAGGQVARGGQMGVLGNQDNMDVPFTLTSYTSKLIEDQQAEDVGDVLLNDPSVRQSFGFGNQAQVFVIRGLPLSSDDISYNGLYGVLPRQIISTDAVERVEVFKGPNAFINGVSPTGTGLGGSVNLVPKRAGDEPIRRYTQDISTDGRVGEHLDLGQRFGEDNRFGARVNLAQREGDTAIDDESQRTKLFTLGLDYRGDNFRLSGDFGYQKQRINNLRNSVRLGTITSIPRAPDASHNYGQDWTYSQTEDTFGMLRGEWDLNEDWTAYVAGGAKHTRENGVYGTPVLTDSSTGAATIGGSKIPHDEDNATFMTGINGNLQTGPVSHQISVGASSIWTEQRNAYEFYQSTGTTNIYNTAPLAKPTAVSFAAGDMSDPGITGKTRNRSLAVSDTLGFFDDKVLVTAGLRRQQLLVQNYAYESTTGVGGSRTSMYDEAITTPVYGIVYKPVESVSLFANRIEGLSAGPTASGQVVNVGEAFPPGRTKQVEAGIKLDKQSWGATLAAFRIERPTDGFTQSFATPGGGTVDVYVRDGKQVNRGVELSVFGEPVEGLRLMAGGTRLQSELQDTAGGLNDGNHAIGVPTFQLNATVDWDVPGLNGLALNARALRTGGQYADQANTLSLPTWNRFDAGARYTFKVERKAVTLRMNVENITDKNYWASANGGYLTQGEPRLVKFSGTVDF
ncbi:TonB-dependent siderophore receptor [Pseudomonas sp. CFBP 8771]|uniref:TonB-dependent receptor n=1 Tax=unclassified Pseudomonas TaxID=196821 RepID=UPI00177E47CC|nr:MULTISPECIES: TonB-dependent siderophore receptor [unclassified Pseudomonas]MBD8604916.1 TonB-dependent siderophore receptor [Pseudomonas sp. CFBP 8771]MBD8828821.1 TonB-dependent siderophore receptor [Pseudomonas sp. CFBP 13602]